MIYLLRHGEIADATDRRYIGQTDCTLGQSGRARQFSGKNGFTTKRSLPYFARLRLYMTLNHQRSVKHIIHLHQWEKFT